MDNRRVYEDDQSIRLTAGFTTFTINAHHAAFANQNSVWIYDNFNPKNEPVKLRYGSGKRRGCLVMALSPVPSNCLLALAKGRKIFIFDVQSGTRKIALRGNGHNVTSISFSPWNTDLIATGAADGSVCVWSLGNVFRPLYYLYGIGSACRSLSFNKSDSNLLTAGFSGKLLTWNVHSSFTASVPLKSGQNVDLLLNPADGISKIIAVSKRGFLEIWDLRYPDAGYTSSSAGSEIESETCEDRILQQDETCRFSCVASLSFGFSVLQAELIGNSGMAVLLKHGLLIVFYLFSAGYTSIVEEWRLSPSHQVHAIGLRFQRSQAILVTYGATGFQTHEIPSSVCDHLGCNSYSQEPLHGDGSRKKARTSTDSQNGTMVPEPIPQFPGDGPFHRPTRKELLSERYRLKSTRNKPVSRPSTAHSAARTELLDLPPLSDSLDLPALGMMERDSFMPFLSPSIPASRELPIEIAALDESLHLPPLARASFNSATVTAHDSDSDDDALSGPLVSSGTLLPGGVNVPLPRTCGALFSPSGHLIIFLPSKPRPASVVDEQQPPNSSPNESQELEVTRLFPTFGNLSFIGAPKDSLSDSISMLSADSELAGAQRLGLQASSFDSRHKWNTKAQTAPAKVGPLLNETKIRVSIYDASALSLLRKDLAKQYRLVCNDGETHLDLCRFNADKATAAGLFDVADVWATLALGIQRDDGIPSKLKDSRILNSPAFTKTVGFPFEYPNGSFELDLSNSSVLLQSSLLGNTWIVRRLVNWAELQGDVQTLTYVAVMVLVSSEKRIERNRNGLAAYSPSRFTGGTDQGSDVAAGGGDATPHADRFLRTDTIERGHMNGSSVREPISAASSRSPSQPVTPYLHSALSTPPLIFSTSSRRNTRLSASGSASPEHSRSSFSAAAKYYAQSITDKFASYGTSPPIKKIEGSPSLELSSSLPATSGSWTKSVSFASTDNTAGNSRRGLGIGNDDGDSDSDKTIDENSHPHTPKSLDLSVPIVWHQEDETVDIKSRPLGILEILREIQAKSRTWCGYYAERLRSWDMMFEATELEKIAGLTTATSTQTGGSGSGVQPHPIADMKHATCGICCCLIHAAQQGCPACGHTTHPKCLEDYLESLVSLEFTCPTGCGCDCTSAQEATFVDSMMRARDHSSLRPASKVMKKRASLTDPRRVRARIEGESW